MDVRKSVLFPLFTLLLTSACSLAQAEADHRFSGFATLGVALNSSDELVFRNDVTQDNGAYKNNGYWMNDSRLGLQWQGRWSAQWETTVQIVAKDRFDNTPANSFEWAFVRYRPVDGLDLRLGRLGVDAFMLSDFRQVGYTLPWVRPPQDLYGLTSIYHFDGMDLTKRVALGDATLNLKAFYGNSDEKYPTGFNNGRHINFDFDLFGLSSTLEWREWKLRYSVVTVEVNSDLTQPLRNAWTQFTPLWPGAGEFASKLQSKNRDFRYHQLGLNYDNNGWWFQSEYVRISSDLMLVTNAEHAYASLGKRFGSLGIYGLTGYASPRQAELGIALPTGLPEPYGSQLQYLSLATRNRINGARIKQHSYGIGARWDFTAKMALKLQIEEFTVDKAGAGLWFATNAAQDSNSDHDPRVTSLALDVLF